MGDNLLFCGRCQELWPADAHDIHVRVADLARKAAAAEPRGIAAESITVNGHHYVHVAACPCPEMRAALDIEVERHVWGLGEEDEPYHDPTGYSHE